MPREQPINADVPAAESTTEAEPSGGGAVKAPPKPPGPPKAPASRRGPRKRPPMPLPLKLIAGAIVVAAVFIIAAIIGGGNGGRNLPGAAPEVGGGSATSDGASAPAAAADTSELGYPAFATKNTTRIGGSDPPANAAGAALAVFPSTDDGQRPAAVTLVDESDWAGGIAAAVLMAAPVRAPILLTSGDDLPDATSEALAALDPQGSAATHSTAVFAVGGAPEPGGRQTTAVSGKGPAALAAGLSKLRDRLFGSAPRHIVIAPLDAPAFAMPAAAWAARSGDPVLFAGRKSLPKATAAVLREHAKAPVYVLGPSSAIASDVVRTIAKIDRRVHRVSAEEPVGNAVAFARYGDGDFGWNINDPGHGFVVARSDDPIEAAAAAPLSASGTWGPLLLTDDADTLPSALHGYLLDVKPGYTEDPTRAFYNHVWVIGDEEAIGVGQQAEIDGLAELAKIGGGE